MLPGMTDLLGAAARRQLARQTRDPDVRSVEAASAPLRVAPDRCQSRRNRTFERSLSQEGMTR